MANTIKIKLPENLFLDDLEFDYEYQIVEVVERAVVLEFSSAGVAPTLSFTNSFSEVGTYNRYNRIYQSIIDTVKASGIEGPTFIANLPAQIPFGVCIDTFGYFDTWPETYLNELIPTQTPSIVDGVWMDTFRRVAFYEVVIQDVRQYFLVDAALNEIFYSMFLWRTGDLTEQRVSNSNNWWAEPTIFSGRWLIIPSASDAQVNVGTPVLLIFEDIRGGLYRPEDIPLDVYLTTQNPSEDPSEALVSNMHILKNGVWQKVTPYIKTDGVFIKSTSLYYK